MGCMVTGTWVNQKANIGLLKYQLNKTNIGFSKNLFEFFEKRNIWDF